MIPPLRCQLLPCIAAVRFATPRMTASNFPASQDRLAPSSLLLPASFMPCDSDIRYTRRFNVLLWVCVPPNADINGPH